MSKKNFSIFTSAFIAILGAVTGAIVGGTLVEQATRSQYEYELEINSLNMAQSIAYILVLERKSLKQVYNMIKKIKEKSSFEQNNFIQPLYIEITKEDLNKMLSYTKFNNDNYFRETTTMYETLLLAEQNYKECYNLLNEYKQALDDSLEWDAIGKPAIAAKNLAEKTKNDSQLSFVYLGKKCQEAILLNEKAKEKLDKLSEKIFGLNYRFISN